MALFIPFQIPLRAASGYFYHLSALSLLADPPHTPAPSPVDPERTGVCGLGPLQGAVCLTPHVGGSALCFFLSRLSCLWNQVWLICEQLARDHFPAFYGNQANALVTHAHKIITGMSGPGFGIISTRIWWLRWPLAIFPPLSQGDPFLGSLSGLTAS